jgi:hypothetical protein
MSEVGRKSDGRGVYDEAASCRWPLPTGRHGDTDQRCSWYGLGLSVRVAEGAFTVARYTMTRVSSRVRSVSLFRVRN